MTAQTLLERAAKIRVLVLDVDGVLTEGSIHVGPEGELFKSFNVRDGLGIKLLQRGGIEVCILTGRTSSMVARRADELGLRRVEQGKLEKFPTLRKMLAEAGVSLEETAYMGDDLPDLPCLTRVGFAATPADGNPDLEPYVHWRSSRPGGRGAVRELAELLLRAQGKWEEIMKTSYLKDYD